VAKPITVSKLTGGIESAPPAGFTHSIRAAQIREATLAVCRAVQWLNVTRSPAEHAQAQKTLRQANRALLHLNLNPP